MKKISRLVILSLVLLTGFMGFQLRNIVFDYDFEAFFPTNSEETKYYEDYRATFENDNDYVLIGLENEEGIFKKDFLLEVDRLYEAIEQLPLILSVQSPTRFEQYKRDKLTPRIIKRRFLNINNPATYQRDSTIIAQNPVFDGFLFANDKQSVMLYINHEANLTNEDCAVLCDSINNVLAQFDFDRIYVAGKCFGQVNFINIIEEESLIFINASTLIIILFLGLTYRRFWGIWLPIAVVGLTVINTVGIMVLSHKSLDALSNTIPTILLVIGISDAIHLLTNYLARISPNMNKWEAMKASIKEVGVATMITSFTTMIGFMTLLPSSFQPIVDLGIYATIGLIIAFVMTYLFIPAAVMLHPPLKPIKSFETIEQYLAKAHDWVMAHPKTIITGGALVFLIGAIGISKIKMNNYILEDLKASHPLRIDFDYFSDNFAGARPFELGVELKNQDDSIFDFAVFQEIEQLNNYLTDTYGAGGLLSPVVLLKNLNQIYHFGKPEFYTIPKDKGEFDYIARLLKENSTDSEVDIHKVISKDFKQARIHGKLPDIGSYIIRKKDEALKTFATENFKYIDIRLTGSGYLMDLNTSYLSGNVLNGLAIAVGIISLLFAFLFRSIKIVFITLISNLLPLFFIGGIMGFMGIDLKISTSIIFIVAFGIAVDDSIHFLTRFRHESKTNKLSTAIKNTYLSTGKAILLTSFILIGGFLVLCLSSFLGIFYIGFLIAVTLVVALITDLTLLPVLLKILEKKKYE